MSRGKQLATASLSPFAWAAGQVAEPLRRAWAHARLAMKIASPLDPSVVILGVPEIHGTGRISLGKNLFLYRELYWETQETGSIVVGNDVVMSRGVHVVSFCRVSIGDGTMIGEYTSIRDANHRIRTGLPIRVSGHEAAPITIGRNVWIARGVMVLPGVTIGDEAVIGANAVVTKDVPAGAIAVGVPAHPLAETRAA
jgi:acetyltransferase-like isoleucine patch superfamily enzyme